MSVREISHVSVSHQGNGNVTKKKSFTFSYFTMSLSKKITFSELCINGKLVTLDSEGGVNQCEVYQKHGRYVVLLMGNSIN